MDPFWRYHDDPLYFDLVNTLCSLIREGVTAQELRNAVSIAEEKLREEHERHGLDKNLREILSVRKERGGEE